jgi:hypothetical protein
MLEIFRKRKERPFEIKSLQDRLSQSGPASSVAINLEKKLSCKGLNLLGVSD